MRFSFVPTSWSAQDLELARTAVTEASTRPEAGFWPQALDSTTWSTVRRRAEEIGAQKARTVVCGVGGSSLGARTLSVVGKKPLFFLEHLDPESLEQLRHQLGSLKDLHWLWISKSGTTLETLTNLNVVSGWYRQANLNLAHASTVIAEPRPSPLGKWAQTHDIPTLDIPASVSGRFSVLSPAGLLPAALAGVDLSELERGIRAVNPHSLEIAELVSATLASWQRGEWTTALWTYCDRLRPLVAWIQQLWAESLAKAKTRSGHQAPRASFPVPCAGSIDQHSILQQFVEGAKTNWIWILRVDELENSGEIIEASLLPETEWLKGRRCGEVFGAQAEGTLRALTEAKVSTFEWRWPKLDAFHLGYALFTMEIVVAALGERLGIHTFNQPGVERGKVITLELLRR